jgi:DNA-binding GntR family transcriptional regulator
MIFEEKDKIETALAVTTNRRISLRYQIFNYLSHQIENSKLTPGSFLNVKQLTEDLGVSRTPLREALAQLESQGFVTILPQRGVRINVLTLEEVLDIFEILGALESHVLLAVFENIHAEEIHAMDRYNRHMSNAIALEKNRDFHESNIKLHRVFLELSKNKELINYTNNLKLKLFGFALKSYRKRFKEAIVREHNEFIALLWRRKKRQAADFLKNVHWKFNYPDNFIRPDKI